MRELQNTIRNIAVLQDGDTVTPDMFPSLEGQTDLAAPDAATLTERPAHLSSSSPASTVENNLMGTLAEIERKAIEDRIAIFDGSIPKAAESLGVSPSTIYRKKENWD